MSPVQLFDGNYGYVPSLIVFMVVSLFSACAHIYDKRDISDFGRGFGLEALGARTTCSR